MKSVSFLSPGLHFLPALLFAGAAFAQVTLNPIPTRVIGQNSTTINSPAPNLVEGREFFNPQSVALDNSTNPPALYVADTSNNRILGFRSAVGFANGQKADVVVGQLDFNGTFPAGPGTSRSTGLAGPTGIAVDSHGNLYVVDSGNNRVLRFPQPLNQSLPVLPDLVIGQSSYTTNGANQGGISASSLAFTFTNNSTATPTTSTLAAFIALDSSANLWVSDAANNRVLRFNASVLGSTATPGPAADLVLGQPDFVTNTYTAPADPLASLTAFTTPTGIAFDTAGRLFVDESISTRRGRILMWAPPFSSGQPASGLLGVYEDPAPVATVSNVQLGLGPGALFPIDNGIGVVDTGFNRILVFPPVEQWVPDQTYQAAIAVAGQLDFASASPNQGKPTTGPDRLAGPNGAVFFGSELYIADSANSRVIVMPRNGTSFGPATRVLGQDVFITNSVNLVEGREFDFTGLNGNTPGDVGMAVDLSSSPPHLYISDSFNNRILGYNDLRNLQPGQKADIVIGQPDFRQTLVNYPSNSAGTPNSSGLFHPAGLAVDSAGNLWVADEGNGRVLRFPSPFNNYTPGTAESADLYLGQIGFNQTIKDPTNRTMSAPYGLAFASTHGLLVSDVAHNRVLFFPGEKGAFTAGEPASIVFGQPDFNSSAAGAGANQLSGPHHIATDSDDRLYVADTANGRVQIFDHAPTASANPFAADSLSSGLSLPWGLYVNPINGEIWVSNAGNGTAVRFVDFNQLVAGNGTPTPNAGLTDQARPIGVVEDPWGNLFMADSANRVVIYYPGLGAINAANFLGTNFLAPGMIAALFSQGVTGQFGAGSQNASTLPLPTTLNGVQVLFNGSPTPLFYAGPGQINFQVPMGAPQSGLADLQVIESGTGRILGDTTVVMNRVDPGLFTQSGFGFGAAAALNQDNTVNTQTNQANQGEVITIFGTGQGFIPNAPPDGNISNRQLLTPTKPFVIMGTARIPDENILYYGLAPTLVGVWQLNLKIPLDVITTPTSPTQVVIVQDSVASGGGGVGRAVIIYVKQRP